jgi:hypothetical protein
MTAEGALIVMPPNYSVTAARNGEIMAQLRNWARPEGGGICTDSSGDSCSQVALAVRPMQRGPKEAVSDN